MYDLAPGTILQYSYRKRRLKKIGVNGLFFIEVGAGNGNISNILLENGMTGVGFDLSKGACENNAKKNSSFIEGNKYRIENSDFLLYDGPKADIVISSHVIEHLPEESVRRFFLKASSILTTQGRIISLIPSNMKYWGIEDETAGHYRRYDYADFYALSKEFGFKINDLAGLTYPLSNFLLKASNYLIGKEEGWKKNISMDERTLLSSAGVKQVKFKTYFPSYFRLFINEITLFPFVLLQLFNRKHPNCMVIYSEFSNSGSAPLT